jgi:hypothetical protein
MGLLADLLFYGYTGLLIVAGAWGVGGARLDHKILFGLDPATLEWKAAASLLSQYRFLRAVECGFGAFAVMFKPQIFTVRSFNSLFLATMVAGVLARIISRVIDGTPRRIFDFFLLSEAIGAVVIFLHTRDMLGIN